MNTQLDHTECHAKLARLTARLLAGAEHTRFPQIDVVKMDEHGNQIAVHIRDVYTDYQYPGHLMIVVK